MLDRQACLPNLPAGHLGDSTQYENTRQLAVPFSPLQITYSEGSQCALTMHVHSRVIVNNHSAGLRYDGLYLVAGRDLVPSRGNHPQFCQFRLVRMLEQPPLDSAKSRPTTADYAAARIRSMTIWPLTIPR
jgi:hypothetical protein